MGSLAQPSSPPYRRPWPTPAAGLDAVVVSADVGVIRVADHVLVALAEPRKDAAARLAHTQRLLVDVRPWGPPDTRPHAADAP